MTKFIIAPLLMATSLMVNANLNLIDNMKNGDDNTQNLGIKRMPDTITIDSPIEAELGIVVKDKKVFANLTFKNISEQDAYIDMNKIGGKSVKEEIFFLTPYYRPGGNLTFSSRGLFSQSITEDYSIIKSGEVINTTTELTKYYDFEEKEYEILSFIYVCSMKLMDQNLNQVMEKDRGGMMRPVNFYITSNRIVLNYKDDIRGY